MCLTWRTIKLQLLALYLFSCLLLITVLLMLLGESVDVLFHQDLSLNSLSVSVVHISDGSRMSYK